jgi:hypothetical protein
VPTSRAKALKQIVAHRIPPLRRVLTQRDNLVLTLAEVKAESERLRRHAEQLAMAVEARDGEVAGAPAGLGYLVIVTYGRSGSTLLQGILNSIPGYVIRGENRDAIRYLFEYQRHILAQKAEHTNRRPLGPRKAWFGIDEVPEDVSLASLRSVVLRTLLRPEPGTRVIGFKEIRWWAGDWEEYVDFLAQLLPGLRVVINTRNHDDVAKSKWWPEREDPMGMLERYERRLDEIEARFGERAYRLHFDDWVADPGVLRGLYDWLGEPFDRATVDAVMAVKHSH